ncbi:hypothetical protein LK07_04465 [Streptomyces pluripotens]|uniref:Uncharacterized protein n=1 Tax=Streptomyces pluripotens TaxID=1355015 RepID=A0A221NTZ5_9ACTN|nr:hypothetical protein [Streptomyces pluripotens]ARP69143.1 hypothetical protein LK06_003380 [Streptomyces pluripotens]ASN23404.1 hypothetical protein LK07_04465 [Streptomyces pluripotens]
MGPRPRSAALRHPSQAGSRLPTINPRYVRKWARSSVRDWARSRVRRHQATWKYLRRAPVPFGDLAWDHVSHQLPKATEEELAEAVAALLTRAHAGPARSAAKKSRKSATAKKDRRVAARTKATTPTAATTPPPPSTQDEPAPHEPAEDEETMAEVIPLGLFDPLEDPWKRS